MSRQFQVDPHLATLMRPEERSDGGTHRVMNLPGEDLARLCFDNSLPGYFTLEIPVCREVMPRPGCQRIEFCGRPDVWIELVQGDTDYRR